MPLLAAEVYPDTPPAEQRTKIRVWAKARDLEQVEIDDDSPFSGGNELEPTLDVSYPRTGHGICS